MSTAGYLERNGMTNKQSEDLGVLANHDIAAIVFIPSAFCTSVTCTHDIRGHGAKVPKPGVSRSASNCPDCGNALYWTTVKQIKR